MEIHNNVNAGLEFKCMFVTLGEDFPKHITDPVTSGNVIL